MKTPSPADYEAMPGDIVHCRGHRVASWLIRLGTHGWGNHDGTLVFLAGAWWIAEAEGQGFVLTSWQAYARDIAANKLSVAFLRIAGSTQGQGAEMARLAMERAVEATEYSWKSIRYIVRTIILGGRIAKKLGWNKEDKWQNYCTDSVRDFAREVSPKLDVWDTPLPTPRTTENRLCKGKLTLLGEIVCKRDKYLATWLTNEGRM